MKDARQILVEKMVQSVYTFSCSEHRKEADMMLQVVLDEIDSIVETDGHCDVCRPFAKLKPSFRKDK